MSITASEFEVLVKKHYQFLTADFRFSLNKQGEWLFIFESKNTKVSLLVEHESLLSVALAPIGDEAARLLRQNILPDAVSVIVISMCLDPTLQYKVDNDISVETEKQAELLKKYCRKMLNGDFSNWGAIQNCMSRRAYEFLSIWRRNQN